jgi:hypothetical protein
MGLVIALESAKEEGVLVAERPVQAPGMYAQLSGEI